MKNKMIFMAICLGMFTDPALAAGNIRGMCELIAEMKGIFTLIRTLAFVGAGFLLAKYAWEAISTGKLNGEADLVKGAQKTGVPMLVGLILLFAIGTILQVLSSATGVELMGCKDEIFQGW